MRGNIQMSLGSSVGSSPKGSPGGFRHFFRRKRTPKSDVFVCFGRNFWDFFSQLGVGMFFFWKGFFLPETNSKDGPLWLHQDTLRHHIQHGTGPHITDSLVILHFF